MKPIEVYNNGKKAQKKANIDVLDINFISLILNYELMNRFLQSSERRD